MSGLRLIEPSAEWRETFADMAREYLASGDHRYVLGLEDFDRYLSAVARRSKPDASRQDRVPGLEFWLEQGGLLVGGLRLRLWLNSALEHEGGHIGYDVRPSNRRRGYATAALRLGLERARVLGIGRVLITTDSDNEASIKVIERNGGVFNREVTSHESGKLIRQYWIDMSPC
jgi:predicted acetyltransferase